MSTKSQKTEDMLDQTFANFDNEATGAETQQTHEQAEAKPAGTKKSNNMAVFIGAGVTAVGAVAYLFVLKPMLAGPAHNPAPAPVVAKAPVTPMPVQTPAEAPKPVENAIPPVQAPTTAEVKVEAPVAAAVVAPTTPATNPVAPTEVKVDAPVGVAAAIQAPTTSATTPAVPVTQQGTQPAPTEVKVDAPVAQNAQAPKVGSSGVQSPAVDELKTLFDQQTSEFKTVLTDIDSRVGSMEGAIHEQKDINNKFEQRITALEAKKTVVKEVKETKKVSVATPTHVAKKKASIKKEVAKNDGSVLVDKSTEATKTKVEKVEKAEKANLPQVALHSIYGGRLWVKNADGSLSTFSSGDKLPTGEVIKTIDDEKFEVTTDKRVIRH